MVFEGTFDEIVENFKKDSNTGDRNEDTESSNSGKLTSKSKCINTITIEDNLSLKYTLTASTEAMRVLM